MISVIIPLMAIEPYAMQVHDTLDCLRKQTEKHHVILSEQPIEQFINKNKLLNQGFELATGEFVWHCDADFLFGPTLLKDMIASVKMTGKDVVFPMFEREMQGEKRMKIAEGGPFMRRRVLERHGPLDETILGINYTTFPFLKWITENTVWGCSPSLLIKLNKEGPQAKKCHRPSAFRLQKLGEEMASKLKDMGYIETRTVKHPERGLAI